MVRFLDGHQELIVFLGPRGQRRNVLSVGQLSRSDAVLIRGQQRLDCLTPGLAHYLDRLIASIGISPHTSRISAMAASRTHAGSGPKFLGSLALRSVLEP
jgi:hypothetical protein